jgi:hypothetical protein
MIDEIRSLFKMNPNLEMHDQEQQHDLVCQILELYECLEDVHVRLCLEHHQEYTHEQVNMRPRKYPNYVVQ